MIEKDQLWLETNEIFLKIVKYYWKLLNIIENNQITLKLIKYYRK